MKTVFFVVGILVLCTIAAARFGGQQRTFAEEKKTKALEDRVAALEDKVAALDQQIRDDKLASRLRGKWIEESWIRSGTRIDESKEVFGGGGGGTGGDVAWLLATDTSSQRIVLSPEPSSTFYGKFAVDTSKSPAWIDLQVFVERDAKYYPVRGIVKYTFGRTKIAIPTKLFDGDKFLAPPRPTTFNSTVENGYSVYSLIRESFKRTGVW